MVGEIRFFFSILLKTTALDEIEVVTSKYVHMLGGCAKFRCEIGRFLNFLPCMDFVCRDICLNLFMLAGFGFWCKIHRFDFVFIEMLATTNRIIATI